MERFGVNTSFATTSEEAGSAAPKSLPRKLGIAKPGTEQIVMAIIFSVVIVALPWLNLGYRFLSIAVSTGYTAIALYGLGLQFGQAGIMSTGHSALVGMGAYTAAILANQFGIGFWGAIPLSLIIASAVGGLISLPSLRVGGQHYIIITFCCCALLVIVLTNGGKFTGGATGLDVASIHPIFGLNFDKLINAYYLVALTLVIALVAFYCIVNSPYGRTLRAIRENEQLARAIGINVDMHKIGVCMVSGLFAGLGGVLQVYYLHHISPTLYGVSTAA